MSQANLLDATEAQAINLSEATQLSASGIVSRTVLQSPEARVVLFTFAEGQELTSHTNRRRALIQILTGECEFFFGDRWQRLVPGTFLNLPPNAPHAVRATLGAFSMLLTLCAELPASTSSS